MRNHPSLSPRKKRSLLWVGGAVLAAGLFAAGWYSEKIFNVFSIPLPLRLGGYQLISPLLSCNITNANIFPQDPGVGNAIRSAIATHQNAGDISEASVYFTDFADGKWANVNGDQKYYPASLGKVPIMMAYFEAAENSSAVLDAQESYPTGLPDQNAQQEIPPSHAIVPGKNYSVSDLIDYMMKYSDNNAALTLAVNADQDALTNVYSNLQIPLSQDVTASTSDIMTPRQYSILFRTLYNATYLSRDYSEAALKIMTETDFNQGIVAGVPSSTVVAHKYGLASFVQGSSTLAWDLNDCGIVYAPSHPYLMCIMTRGSKSIAAQEDTIADISKEVYRKIEPNVQ